MSNKLWIIGDSFADHSRCGSPSWVELISKKFMGKKYYTSSRASRDFQTIIDIFLKNLKYIGKDDLVILIVPFIGRTRLPLYSPVYDVSLSNFVPLKGRKDYFIGTSSYTKESEHYKLEKPLTYANQDDMNDGTDLWSIVNSSNASKKNYVEIIQSFKEYFPFNIFIWSWENVLKSDIIINKTQIKKEIGFWHTYKDLYKETKGMHGYPNDFHFSPKMHTAFADWIINKFPEYFDKDLEV
jgi:hypothetical protein